MVALFEIKPELFLNAGFKIISEAYKTLTTYARYGLKRASQQLIDTTKEKSNQPILADKLAEESAFLQLVESPLGRRIERLYHLTTGDWIYGEESLDKVPINVNLTETEYPVALLDMLDGSDLFKRRFSNWCIAVVFYVPKPAEIIAAFVGDALGRIYYASKSEEGAYLVSVNTPKSRRNQERERSNPMAGREEEPKLKSATICFYGQKKEEFYDVANRKRLIEALDPKKGARIYNLGGNPMLARVADGSVDIVLNPGTGQKPHDVIPGLYIATKAGAIALTPEGERLTFDSGHLKEALRRPADNNLRLRYVVAATNNLAIQVVRRLSN